MNTQTFNITASPYRSAGWSAIASGIIGIVAYGSLMTAVTTRTTKVPSQAVYFLFNAHDVGLIIQFLLMIPVVFALYKLSQQRYPGMSKSMLRVGIGAVSFIAFLLPLGILNITSNGLYTFPQGVFGVWLIIVCWRMPHVLPRAVRWLGMVVGPGLVLVGMALIGYLIFVNTLPLQIPSVDPAKYPDSFTLANQIIHYFIYIGSYMGVMTLPVWTILLGRKLLYVKSS
ncbi:MAG: hypothetical protein JWQ57_2185 [Mucilaginibacter sp.]|nr:hypothetical protein [Mucilaginibacter sp.]